MDIKCPKPPKDSDLKVKKYINITVIKACSYISNIWGKNYCHCITYNHWYY